MQIASIGQMSNLAAMQKAPEASEGPGPDHDGDSDNAGVSSMKSATALGVGKMVDTTA